MDQRIVRPRIDDVAREAGVSKTSVSFAFNSPERLAPETAERIRAVAERLGYTPHPVARMLTRRETLTIGVLTPQPLSVVFANPFFGAFAAGVGAAAEASGYAHPVHLPVARVAGRRDAPRHGRRRGRHRPVRRSPGRRRDPARRRPDRPRRLDRAPRRRARSRSTTSAAPARPRSTCSSSDIGTCSSSASSRRRPSWPRPATASPPAVWPATARRWPQPASSSADDDVVLGPATIEGGASALDRAWEAGLRPTGILAMSDALAIGAIGALGARGVSRAAATSASSASMTSRWPPTSTRR